MIVHGSKLQVHFQPHIFVEILDAIIVDKLHLTGRKSNVVLEFQVLTTYWRMLFLQQEKQVPALIQWRFELETFRLVWQVEHTAIVRVEIKIFLANEKFVEWVH